MLATISLNYIAIASQERIAGWLKGLPRNWVDCRTTAEDHDHVSQFLHSTAIINPFAKCSAGIVDCSIFCKSRHNADGFRGNSRIWCNLSQSRGLQRGSGLDCDWGQILTQTHDTKGVIWRLHLQTAIQLQSPCNLGDWKAWTIARRQGDRRGVCTGE